MKLATLALLLTTLSWIGCADDTAPSQNEDALTCQDDNGCLSGEVCVEGVCERDPDCQGEQCESGQAESPRGTPPELCPSSQFEEGICLPLPPRLTPEGGCPGRISEEGICAPLPPDFGQWICPEGWIISDVLTEEGAQTLTEQGATPPTHCLPPESPAQCPPGTMPLVGETQCVRIGLECPPDGTSWHDEESIRGLAPDYEGIIVYVLPQQDPPVEGPDGTRERPFATLQAGLDAAESGGVLALGTGQYDEVLRPAQRTAIVGACVAQTAIVAPDAHEEHGTVRFLDDFESLLSNVRVGGPRVGIEVGASRPVTLQSVHVDGAMGNGILARGSRSLVVTDVLVSDTQPQENGTPGLGLTLIDGAVAEVERASFVRNHDAGVYAIGEGVEMRMVDVLIADTLPEQMEFGLGLAVEDGARVEVERASFVRNQTFGVEVFGRGSELSMVDVLIADTLPQQSDRSFGNGLVVEGGAKVEVERASLLRNYELGVFVNEGTELRMVDVLVADTQPRQSDGIFGGGLQAQIRAVVEIERASFVRNHDAGVNALGEGVEMRMVDVLMADTQPRQSDGTNGRGLTAQEGAMVEIERASFLRNRASGVGTRGEGTVLTLTDVLVADTQGREADMRLGSGLTAENGPTVEVERGSFVRNHDGGVFATGEGVELRMVDVLVADTRPNQADGAGGNGLVVGGGAAVEVERGAFVRNHEGAVFVAGVGSELSMVDVLVADTQPRQRDGDVGRGLNIGKGAVVEVERASFLRNRDINVFVDGEGSELRMVDVLVADTQPQQSDGTHGRGLNVQVYAVVEVERASFLRNHETSVVVAVGELRMVDALVADTRPQESNGDAGRGLEVFESVVEIERASFLRNNQIGVMTYGAAAVLTMTDVKIKQTSASFVPMFEQELGGIGLYALEGSRALLTRFEISQSDLAGITLNRGGTIEGTDGVVRDNFIGINIGDTFIDLEEALKRVDIRENCCGDCSLQVCNVESEDIPVPDASQVIEDLADL